MARVMGWPCLRLLEAHDVDVLSVQLRARLRGMREGEGEAGAGGKVSVSD